MRAFLALTVTASMFLLGYIKREKMKKHERLMREIQLFIKLMKPRTQYLHEPFYKTVEVLSECESLSELIFLKTCTEKRERGEDFPKAWSESLQSFGLGKQDRELLLSFGNAVFSANSTDISSVLALYETEAERRLRETEEETRSEGKMYMSVFSAIGILLGIIIL